MKQRSLEIIVHPNGELQVDAFGFSGADCEKATAFLEQALGARKRKMRKPEYYCQANHKHVQEVGQ
jgi:hypothetical protein